MLRWIGPLGVAVLLVGCGGDGMTTLPPGPAPTGTLAVSWSITDARGNPRDCLDAGVNEVVLRVGGAPTRVDCTVGRRRIDGLLPGRYPFIAQAQASSMVSRSEVTTQVDITASSTTTLPLTFVVEGSAGGSGALVVKWAIDNKAPAVRCAQVSAANVRIKSAEGSTGQFDVVRPCADATYVLAGLVPGSYRVDLRLERADGSRITSILDSTRRVRDGDTIETGTLALFTELTAAPRLRAEWTVNGSVAAQACPTVSARTVTFGIVPVSGGTVETSTRVACTRGFAVIAEGVGPGIVDLQLRLDYGVASFTTTTALQRPVPTTGTATVGFKLLTVD